MTVVDDPVATETAQDVPTDDRMIAERPQGAPAVREPVDPPPPLPIRTIVAASLSTVGAALVTGGIFDSLLARALGVTAALGGVAFAALAIRRRRSTAIQLLLGPMAVLVGAGTLAGTDGGPATVADAVREAISAGGLLQPPVPFDPGWRPILVVLFAFLGYAAAWFGATLHRPILGVAIPLPVIALSGITQPEGSGFTAGLLAFVPLAAALAVTFSTGSGVGLSREFEVARAARACVGGLLVVAALVGAQQFTFLFPEPVIDPSDRPQKPRSVPLSEAVDRVLFTATVPEGFTGPWRTGVLDIYDDGAWKLPGGTTDRLVELDDGTVDPASVDRATLAVEIALGDLGSATAVPTVPTVARLEAGSAGFGPLRWDPRTGTLRVAGGRVPTTRLTMSLPPYPSASALAAVTTPPSSELDDQLDVPRMPDEIRNIVVGAPQDSQWETLDFVRHQLLDNVTAAGAGSPVDVPPDRVVDLLVGSQEGTPFEIVAAQVLLARWSGVPARIGFGFNGGNILDDGRLEVRPRHAAQWLEVWFEGHGWLPLLDVPPKAEASLDDANEDDDTVLASEDVAVDVLVPVEVRDPRLLFELVRARVLQVLPIAALLLGVALASPWVARAVRSRRRTDWADAHGPRAQIGVAYAEFRDFATDLNAGDPFATPIEYLARVQPDEEHLEFAWLVSRVLYGDLAADPRPEDVTAARDMSRSLRHRMWKAQPLQTRALAIVSRASLADPYTAECPNVHLPRPLRALGLAARRAKRRAGLAAVAAARLLRSRRFRPQLRLLTRSPR